MSRTFKLPNPFRRSTRQPESESQIPSSEGYSPEDHLPRVTFPDGVKTLRDCTDASVDICFVHGLTGNRESTWTADGQTVPWPQSLLPPTLERARILTWGYDAYIVPKSVASSNRLLDHATNLLNHITTNRAINKALSRPIIFVAHSLGGLVCKEAILASRNNPEHHLKDVFTNTKAVIFMGTPHTGSWMADWAKIPASALGIVKSTNKSLLKILETDDQLLESLQVRFLSMIRDLQPRRLEVTCFFEELPLLGFGKVVEKNSATFAGYNPISIHANHRNMVKFSSADETGFTSVLGELIRWESEISNLRLSTTAPTDRGSEKSKVHRITAHKRRRANTGLSDSAAGSQGVMDLDQMVQHAIHKASNTDDPKDPTLPSALFGLPNDERAQAAALKCVKALRLEESVKQIAHCRAMSQSLRNMDLDYGILIIALTQVEEQLRQHETEVKSTYSSAVARCLTSLSFSEMGAREANIEGPTQNTCKWIYNNPKFRQWESQINTLLWIKGKPGSGKSTLMKSLHKKRILEQEQRAENPKTTSSSLSTIHLSFFFNARGSAIEKTPIGLYKTLFYGLLRCIPLVMCEFIPAFIDKEFCTQNSNISWQMTELADAVHSIIGKTQPNNIEIMIDALDECEDDEVRSAIRRFESSMTNAQVSGAMLKVCWSSRYYPHISLKSQHGLELRLDKENDRDIRRYVEKEMQAGIHASLLPIMEDLISSANGVFLWAVLVTKRLLKAIDQGKDDVELRRLLNSIPPKLDDLFDDIFKNEEDSTARWQDLARMAQYIFCAFRPLTIEEFFTAMTLQSTSKVGRLRELELVGDACDRLEKRIGYVSGGLFEVARAKGTTRVQIIHESVREFFLGPKGLTLLQYSSRETFIVYGHKQLTSTCFKALLSTEFDSVTMRPKLSGPVLLSDTLEFFSMPWNRPRNRFLEDYVQNHVFEHFDLVRGMFGNDASAYSPFESMKVRQRVLENFLRLCCLQLMEHQALPARYNAHLQKVFINPLAFNFQTNDLAILMTFLENLSTNSFFFDAREIYMFKKDHDAVGRNRFIALFYVCRQSNPCLQDMASPELSESFNKTCNFCQYGKNGLDDDSKAPDKSSLCFMFGMTFGGLGKRWLSPKSILDEMLRKQGDDSPVGERRPVFLTGTGITIKEDLDEINDLRDWVNVFKPFSKTRLHGYPNSTTLCMVLEIPKRERSQTCPSKYSEVDDLVGCAVGAMPQNWFHPQERRRDWELFEADTDTDEDYESDSDHIYGYDSRPAPASTPSSDSSSSDESDGRAQNRGLLEGGNGPSPIDSLRSINLELQNFGTQIFPQHAVMKQRKRYQHCVE
ncbi:alpha/beta-Hydrolase [Glarea lozoyensis ATCC 20868]|uniref:Alpha/beta-Hydrolase n=2 Tax=Glarea lozoyensis TaxID=101852 RepID=S3D7W1_GLAL2|nr:alpha/beta-Hydrolase [Glarea lozoyensis ATCC 20868]EPE28101.1 alpha/beta-Hydrolase [Glarea lozoyensis ATCC 20868]